MAQKAQTYNRKHNLYKNVYIVEQNCKVYYISSVVCKGKKYRKTFENEIDAAKAVDIFLINNGEEPKNILKRKL